MNKFTMLVGVAGCGKSTFAEKLAQMGAIIVSTDAIRGELWGDENEQKDPQKVFQEAHRRIKKGLLDGEWVVFDATNLSARRREGFLKQIQHINCEKECVVIITPPQVIKERMKNRERKVPNEVIEKQLRSFQCPLEYEGWHNIHILWDNTCLEEKAGKYIELCDKIKNDNHNHSTETVGDHIDMALLHLGVNYSCGHDVDIELLTEAIRYHDIGKPFTKVFTNSKGEPTKEAHYYGHQNYSAYIYLMTHPEIYFNEVRNYKRIIVANLIQFHMEHFFRSPENLEKFYKKTGLGAELDIIHKCDMAAH